MAILEFLRAIACLMLLGGIIYAALIITPWIWLSVGGMTLYFLTFAIEGFIEGDGKDHE